MLTITDILQPADLSVFPLTHKLKTDYMRINRDQQSGLSKALENLISLHLHTSFYNQLNHSDGDKQELCFSQDYIERCIDGSYLALRLSTNLRLINYSACYSEPQGYVTAFLALYFSDYRRIGLMIERQWMNRTLGGRDMLTLRPTSGAFKCSILALGSHILDIQGRDKFNSSSKEANHSSQYFKKALQLRHEILPGKPSLLNLQVNELIREAPLLTDFNQVSSRSSMAQTQILFDSWKSTNSLIAVPFSSKGITSGIGTDDVFNSVYTEAPSQLSRGSLQSLQN